MRNSAGKWDGGFIYKDAKGRRIYVIRRSVQGKQIEVSTGCTTSSAAHEQLKKFEADPFGYVRGGEKTEKLFLTKKLAESFLHWSMEDAKNTKKWVSEQRRYLAWWAVQLEGRDLRRLNLSEHVIEPLEAATSRPARIRVIKRFFSWMVAERHLMDAKDDLVSRALIAPQARPEQWVKLKAIPTSDFVKVRRHLTGHWKDGVDVLAGTGWHVTELCRFAQTGSIESHPNEKSVHVLVLPQTKNGEMLKTAVSEEVAKAAKRLLKRGSIDQFRLADALKKASRKAKLKNKITPGRFRHSVATEAINSGESPASVAAFLNHKDSRTTRKFYATHAVPAKVKTLL